MIFTQEMVASLGEGVMIPDGDTLYITNNHWIMVVTGVEHHLSLDVLKAVAYAPEPAQTDWRIVVAKEIYLDQGKYLSPRGTQSVDLYLSGYKFSRVSRESIRGLIERYSENLLGASYNMGQLFEAGRAKVQFDKGKRKLSVEPAAQHYQFDLDNRIVCVEAKWFRAFVEAGFEVTCPTNSEGAPRVLGLYNQTASPDIFGFLTPLKNCGPRETKDGRSLLGFYASEISWYTKSDGVESLTDPSHYDMGIVSPTSVGTSAPDRLLLGVAILRWQGLSENEIDHLFREGRIP